MSKRSSETPVISTPSKPLSHLSLSSPSVPALNLDAPQSRLKVNIVSHHQIATWRWADLPAADVCGICQGGYHALCPGAKFPGDEATVVWGEVSHNDIARSAIHCLSRIPHPLPRYLTNLPL